MTGHDRAMAGQVSRWKLCPDQKPLPGCAPVPTGRKLALGFQVAIVTTRFDSDAKPDDAETKRDALAATCDDFIPKSVVGRIIYDAAATARLDFQAHISASGYFH